MLLLSVALATPDVPCHREHAEEVASSWSELSVERRVELAPFAPIAPMTAPLDPVTCIGPRAAESFETEHFVVEWDNGGAIDDARAMGVAEALELSWDRLFGDLGWLEPAGTGTYKVRVWVSDDPFEGGFTTEVDCDGLALPTITIGAGTFDYEGWYQDVSAHELLHTSHYRYGRAFDNWWWEATAIWIQEQVYPDNDEWAYYVDFYTRFPWWPLEETTYEGDRARHMYGTALWVFWLEQEHGGHDYVRGLWERSMDLPGDKGATMADLVADDFDMDAEFTTYALAIPLGGVGDAALYDGPTHQEVSSLPTSGTPEVDERPEPWGMHYLRFTGDALAPEGLAIDLITDEGTSLQFTLAGVIDGEVAETVSDLDEGTLLLPNANSYDEAWLVAIAHGGSGGQYFAWEARDASVPPDTDTDTDPVDTGSPVTGVDEGDDVDKGCGCQTQVDTRSWSLLARRR